MICAELTASGVAVAPVQPADMAGCAVVLIAGSDVAAINSISPPTPSDFAAAWGLGFTLVVTSYLISWPVGALLRFIGWLEPK